LQGSRRWLLTAIERRRTFVAPLLPQCSESAHAAVAAKAVRAACDCIPQPAQFVQLRPMDMQINTKHSTDATLA